MITVTYLASNGQIIGKGFSNQDEHPTPPPGIRILKVEDRDYNDIDLVHDYIDLPSKSFLRKPPRPTEWHQFNFMTRLWELDSSAAWAAVRLERDKRLIQCDWTTLPDVPLTPEQRQRWGEYRQALRDVTKQQDPLAIVWPTSVT